MMAGNIEKNDMDRLDKIYDEIIDKENETFSFSKEELKLAITTQLKKVMQMACEMSHLTHLAVINLCILLMTEKNSGKVTLPTIYLSNETNRNFLDSIYNNVTELSNDFYLSLKLAERQWK